MTLEDVIKAMECCQSNQIGGLGCDRCPNLHIEDCEGLLHHFALELLKAQEPSVMNDIDFINNPNIDSQGFLPAWIEYRRDGEWLEYWDDTDDEWSSVRADNYKGEGYRCWTSRPTDEQRSEIPWN